MVLILSLAFVLMLAPFLAGCRNPAPVEEKPAATSPDAAPLNVFASIPPVAFLIEQIGGDLVHAQVLLQAGQEPHTFEPTPRQIAALSACRQFYIVGTLPFEEALAERLASGTGGLEVVELSKGIALRELEPDGHEYHDHGHEHGVGADPHVWLGPGELRTMAENTAEALSNTVPEYASEFDANLKDFMAKVNEVDGRIRQTLAPYEGDSVYVFHPAFGYFTNTYGLKQEAVEIQGKSPRPKQIQTLIERARADGARILFVQPQFDAKSAETVAEAIGGTLIRIDPLAKNVLKNFEDMAVKLEEALARTSPPETPESTEGEARSGG